MPEILSNSVKDARLAKVRQRLTEKEIDALLLTDIDNVGYVSGFTGSTAYALVTPEDAVLVTDPRYTLRARAECPEFVLATAQGSGGYPEALTESLRARPQIKKLGFEAQQVTVAQWEKMKKDTPPDLLWTATEGIIENLRMVKDDFEITAIRAAIKVAESAWLEVKPWLKPNVTEQEFALELEFAMRRLGAQTVAFETIVASGALGAHPHHRAGERPFAPGDLVTIDWGASLNGYVSDITRTVGIGFLSDEQREIYDIVLQAQQRAIAAIQPGRNGKEIDAIARDYIAAHGHGDEFGHSLGHSIGRHVHDGAGFSVRSENVILEPGMVLTVEPGIYIENWGGIRIEEDVLVTEAGHEVLTHLPNALEVLI
jgi:Xaa-Pro aminopeptidase